MKVFACEIAYFHNEKQNNIGYTSSFENEHLKSFFIYDNNNIKVVIEPKTQIALKKAKIIIDLKDHDYDYIWLNGFQSWTETREFTDKFPMKKLSLLGKLVDKFFKISLYGDIPILPFSTKNKLWGFDFFYFRKNNDVLFFKSNNYSNFYTIYSFDKKTKILEIHADVCHAAINSAINIIDVSVYQTTIEKIKTLFPQKNIKKLTGWTSWYNYYQKINEQIILENFENFRKLYPQGSVFQIDDGYQSAVGDWLVIDNVKFPKGLRHIAQTIKEAGYIPGLWIAPFVAQKNSLIFQNNKDWFLKDESGKYIIAGSNWGGFYVLDIFNSYVQQYLKDVLQTITQQWGFEFIKVDFIYAVALKPLNGLSRAQVLTYALKFLRECLPNVTILGCGTPLAQAINYVDYCRIGPDMGLNWNGLFYEKWLHRERISCYNSLNNTISRFWMDGIFWGNDPDVFFLRKKVSLSSNQKITIFLLNTIFGSLVFTSDNFNSYSENEQILIKNLNFFLKSTVNYINYEDDLVFFKFTIDDMNFNGVCNLSNKNAQLSFNIGKKFDIYKLEFIDYNSNKLKPYETIIFA